MLPPAPSLAVQQHAIAIVFAAMPSPERWQSTVTKRFEEREYTGSEASVIAVPATIGVSVLPEHRTRALQAWPTKAPAKWRTRRKTPWFPESEKLKRPRR